MFFIKIFGAVRVKPAICVMITLTPPGATIVVFNPFYQPIKSQLLEIGKNKFHLFNPCAAKTLSTGVNSD